MSAKRRKKRPRRRSWKNPFSGLTPRQRKKILSRMLGSAALLVLALLAFAMVRDKNFPRRMSDLLSPFHKKTGRVLTPGKPKLVFVVDDIGYHLNHEKELKALGRDVTYAILPRLPYSKYFSHLGQSLGVEVILHLPLESRRGTIPGRGLITRNMTAPQILEILSGDLESVPNRVGINNHMGSLATSDPVFMGILLGEARRRHLFFLDSYTTSQSVVSQVGKKFGVRVLKRDVFLDNVMEESSLREQLKAMKKVAMKKGYAIAIGHYHRMTLTFLQRELAGLRKEGFEIISLSELLNLVLPAS